MNYKYYILKIFYNYFIYILIMIYYYKDLILKNKILKRFNNKIFDLIF